MTTRYVDKLGTDTGAGTGTGASAWLTLVYAEDNAIAGDTIEVNAGTYIEADATFGGLHSAKELIWNVTGEVVVQSSTTNHVLILTAAAPAIFTGFVFDAEGANSVLGIIRLASSAANKTVTGGTIKDAATDKEVVNGTTGSNITISNNTISSTNRVNICFNCGNMAGDLTITGNTLSGTFIQLFVADSTTTGDIVFTNNSGTITTAGGNSKILVNAAAGSVTINDNNFSVLTGSDLTRFIDVNRCTDLEIDNNTIDTSASGVTAHTSIEVRASFAGSYTNPYITNNTCLSSTVAGQVILVGDDTGLSSVPSELDGAVITGNIVTSTSNSPHGIEYGYNKNGIVSGNYVYGVGIGIVMKGTEDWLGLDGCSGNLIVDCYDSWIRVKGFKNLNVCDNTMAATSGHAPITSGMLHITDNDTTGGSASNDVNAYNNIFYQHADDHLMVYCPDTASASGLDVDYSYVWDGTSGDGTWIIDGTTYSTWAAWQAVQDGNGTNADPNFVDEVDFELIATLGGGFKWWGNKPRPLGNNGEPKPDSVIDRGCNQKL